MGAPGRRGWLELGPVLRRRHAPDFVIVNCENSAGGFGVTPEIADELLASGVDCLTTGNHVWKQRAIYGYIEREPRLLRPANYPEGAPGRGWGVYPSPHGLVGVLNLMGILGPEPVNCAFRAFDAAYEELKQACSVLVVDFHAEMTSEKVALGHYADGRASLVFGTHTHVQTADERILPGGTGYLTDVGMTGPEEGVIGVQKEQVIEKFLTRMPVRFEVAGGPVLLCGLLADVDPETGRTVRLERIQERLA